MKTISFILSLLLFTIAAQAQKDSISDVEAKNYVGKTMRICGRITQARLKNISKDENNVLFTGDDYESRTLALIFRPDVLKRFKYNPNSKMINHTFCVTGKVVMYEGKPGIYIKDENQINVEE